MTAIGAIGLDLGGQNAVIAVAQKGGVEIITNEASQRETPVVIGFGEQERFIGEQGFVQLKSNFKNTIVFPNRFLGLTPDVSFFEEEKKWLYTPLVITSDNKLAFEVNYKGEKRQFLPEQIVAMMLQKVKQIISKAGFSGQDMVISVPCFYTEQERKALLEAARIAQINVIKIMNTSTATAASYGIFRRAELGTNTRNVCFVDMGHCSTGAYVGSFIKEKTSILNQIQERNLGTRDFDWRLLEFYAKMIQSQYGVNVMSNSKTRLRLLDAIEKQRKILSANSEASINVDNIAEDLDLSYTLTREKFEEIIAPEIERFRNMLKQLKSEIKAPLHSVEIIGGGTRIPIIQKIIQEILGLEISRTLNGSENNARGCAMQSAMLSPVFKFAPYTIEEANYYPIRCAWTFDGASEMEIESETNGADKQSAILFPRDCTIPNAKALTFHRDCDLIIRLFYEDVPKGINTFLAKYVVHSQKTKNPEFSVKVRIALNLNGLVELDHAQLLETFIQDNLAPKSKENDKSFFKSVKGYFSNRKDFPQQEDEVKRSQNTHTTKLNVDVFSNFAEIPNINQLIDLEATMNYQDRMVLESYEKKNELESYVYDFRRRLDEKYGNSIAPETKANLLNILDRTEAWLYGDGAKTTKLAYQSMLDNLKKETLPIETKFK